MKLNYCLLLLSILFTGPACKKGGSPNPAFCGNLTVIETGITDAFQDIYFLDEQTGFVAGYSGSIYKTTDSAKTWTAVNTTMTLPVYSIFFTDALTGYAVGGLNSCIGSGCVVPGGFILKSSDGGNNWTQVYTPTDKTVLRSVFFVNSSTGYCAGDNVILKTSNGGQTWTEYKINNLGAQMMQVRFTDPMNGYITCLSDKFVSTSDGGLSWQVSSPGLNAGYYAIAISDQVLFMGGTGKMVKSVNRGQNWSELPGSPTDIFDLHFITKNQGYALGRGEYSGGDFGFSYGSLFCTNDGGNSWKGTSRLTNSFIITAVCFPVPATGYASSKNKIIKIKN
jgi:photosystem II stability/assembly factor-like uncharacterized protein